MTTTTRLISFLHKKIAFRIFKKNTAGTSKLHKDLHKGPQGTLQATKLATRWISPTLIATLLGLLVLNSPSFADKTSNTPEGKTVQQNPTHESTRDELQKIIDDFEAYIAKIPVNIRDEVKEYRIKIAAINKEKRELYKKISQEAQNYLMEEQKYKKRILDHKKEQTHTPDNEQIDKK